MMPNTRHAEVLGADDDFDKAAVYLDRAVGNRSPKALRDRFLASGPEAVAFLEDEAGVRLRARPFHTDRWQAFSGKAAILDGDGRMFDEVELERVGYDAGARENAEQDAT